MLTLLSRLAQDRPLLVVADDAQWLDRGSLDAQPRPPRGRARQQLLAQAAGNPTLVPMAGGPHNIGWTFPDEVNSALLDFLGK